jgi:hypothetical protein
MVPPAVASVLFTVGYAAVCLALFVHVTKRAQHAVPRVWTVPTDSGVEHVVDCPACRTVQSASYQYCAECATALRSRR